MADGTVQNITSTARKLLIQIEQYFDRLDFEVLETPEHDIILGKPWLYEKNPSIDW